MSTVSGLQANPSRAHRASASDESRRALPQRPVRRALIIFVAALLVSVLAATTMIGFAGLTKSLGWSIVAALLVAAAASWILGFLIWRHHRLVTGPLLVLCCAVLLSLTWLYPGFGSVRPDPVTGIEWLNLPDGTRLAVHVTRATTATEPPIIFVHGGPGVADMAHDAAAFAALATDRDVYVYDRVGTGASSRLADPTGYTTARAVQDLEAVRARTGAPRAVLVGHSWGARFAVAYAQEHGDHVAALVLTAPGDLPLEGADVPPGDPTTRLDTSELAREYLRLLMPRNLFAYELTSADPRVGTSGVGYYAHYVPQLHPDPADVPLHLDQLAMIKVPVLVIKPACDYVAWSAVDGYRQAFPQAQLVMLPDAGHVAYVEQPVLYTDLVHAFLSGQKLPLPTINGTSIPDGYRGTR
jgi:proline iminopeptidase